MAVDPYDVEVVKSYRSVFFQNQEHGLTVLNDILSDLGHYDTRPNPHMPIEAQLALQLAAKTILDKLGIFRLNNVDGYLVALKEVHPRYYESEEDTDA